MRIVLDARTTTHHFPGIGRYTINLARALAPLLGDADELTLLYDPTARSDDDLPALVGSRIALRPVRASVFSLAQQWRVPPRLRGADVYHSPYYLMPFRLRVATVLTLHDLIPLRLPHHYPPHTRALFRAAVQLATAAANDIIVPSQAVASDVRERLGVAPHRVHVIPEAAAPAFAPPTDAAAATTRERLDLRAPYVLCVGSTQRHKNLTRLLEAWARVANTTHQLVIAGPPAARGEGLAGVVTRLKLHDRVRLLGRVHEDALPALYAGATLFVFPSEDEGFGLPVIEAMACGAPVVCSNIASLVELTSDAARHFDPLRIADIAAVLADGLRDTTRHADWRQRGLARAAAFSWERAARATLEVYRSLAAR